MMNTTALFYCASCGEKRHPDARAVDDTWRCARCQRLTRPPSHGDTIQICGKCDSGYLAGAHYCPSCGTISAASPPSTLQTEHGLLPSPFQPIWPTKSWWQEDGAGLEAPPCPKCGEKLRPDGAGSHNHIGQACPPWNAGWDGKCATCGHEMAVTVEQRTHMKTKRVVKIVPAESFHETFRDEGVVFAGVRILIEETAFGDKEPRMSELFLSMGEMAAVGRALEGPLRALQSQMDWTCDWT